ncbi:MAG: hypothetical protein KDD47_24080, partial [Acidobacteria bacterium]|nr:hypothetical protein [Acidobacteriota bacterium]
WLERALATTEELDYEPALDWYGLRFSDSEEDPWKVEVDPEASELQRRHLESWLGEEDSEPALARRPPQAGFSRARVQPGGFSPGGDGPSPGGLPLTDLLPGDLLFRRGRSLNSHAVLLADPEAEFSHVAIVVGEGASQRVVHAVPPEGESTAGGTVEEVVGEFLSPKRATSWAAFRVRSHDRVLAERAARAAEAFARQKLPFDDRFDLEDAGRLYCTELVWEAYRQAGLDLTGGRREHLDFPLTPAQDYILPSTLTSSPDLERLERAHSSETS